mmetsp:Transcript_8107/g.10896  ORF Transcript_8107/g.10896 Transcript_8107/m.10896 type:complete len:97 (-) Transcript_8107:586-876(-)
MLNDENKFVFYLTDIISLGQNSKAMYNTRISVNYLYLCMNGILSHEDGCSEDGKKRLSNACLGGGGSGITAMSSSVNPSGFSPSNPSFAASKHNCF